MKVVGHKVKTWFDFKADPFYLVTIHYENFGGIKGYYVGLLGFVFTLEVHDIHGL